MQADSNDAQGGFTLIELAIVMVVAGLLLTPLLRYIGTAVVTSRLKATNSVLDTASDALTSFAATNGGCLPFAADFEGGLPDTDAGGAASSSPDTGKRGTGSGQAAGDIPWADLGLGNNFLDGDGLRIQYFVASPYTDNNVNQAGITCDAGFRGFQWQSSVTYTAPLNASLWIYDADPNSGLRTLYEISQNKSLAAGTHPDDGADLTAHKNSLPDPLLQLRRGPDVTSATGGQNDVISSQNVFILIAAGNNRNTDIDRLFTRDSTHKTSSGGAWALGIATIDDQIFSSEPNQDAGDSSNSGDDNMLIMSFNRFRSEMNKHGLNMEAVCENSC